MATQVREQVRETTRTEAVARPKIFFPNLDALRTIAFLLVYLEHGFGGVIGFPEGRDIFSTALIKGLFWSGGVAVSFFFVLSGFLITYLILSEIEFTGKIDVLGFYMRRVLRIWPLYYAVVLFGLVIFPAIKKVLGMPATVDVVNPFYYFVFLTNFDAINLGAGHGAMLTAISWSVAIEEQFYIVWPLLFLLVPRHLYRYIFLTIIVLSAAFRFRHVNDGMILGFHTFSIISDMAIGGLAAYSILNSQSLKERIANLPAMAIAITYAAGLILLLFQQYIFVGPVLQASQRMVQGAFFAFILLEQNFGNQSLLKMSRFKTLTKLGIYTYGLYMLHPIPITVFDGLSRRMGLENSVPYQVAFGTMGLALTIILSVLSYHGFEAPFLKLKKRFTHIVSSRTDEGS